MRNRATKALLAVLCLAICLSGCGKQSGPKVPVVSVAEILGVGPIGMVNRYAGVVEAGETSNVNKDSGLEVSEIAVEVGISRQAAHETLTRASAKLTEMENALGVAKRFRRMDTGLEDALKLLRKQDYSGAENKLEELLSIETEESNGI